MKIYNAEIKIITPVIIHTGEYYDFIKIIPLKDNKVALVNPEKIFSRMTEKEQSDFFNLIESDIKKARDIIFNIINRDNSLIENVCKTSGEFTKELMKNPRADVSLIFRNQISGLPYIPGSSIKGLIRTAILENLRLEDEKKGDRAIRYDLRKSSNYELKLLENDYNSIQKVQNDPFKFLKISDFELQDSETYFGTSRIINKSGEGKGIPVYTEMTNAYCFDQKEVIAKGTISIEDNLTLKYWDNGKNKEFNYEDVFDIKRIFKNIDAFYNKITKTETHNNIIGIIDLINDNYFEDEALIRIGRFTQIESKTFKIERENEFYDRKTRDGRRIPLPKDINITGGVSRTLIDGEISAGWCILSITDKKKVNKKEINTNQKTINIKTSENMKPINDIKNKNDSNSQFRNIQKLKEGEIIEVTITAIKPFGAFAKTETGNSGLIHISKITNERVINIEDYLKVGNKEKVKVLEKTEKGWQFSIKDVKNDYDKYLYKED